MEVDNPTLAAVVSGLLFLTRVLADPRTDAFLTRYVPWLAADPSTTGRHRKDTE